jgi:HEAT repeat protein
MGVSTGLVWEVASEMTEQATPDTTDLVFGEIDGSLVFLPRAMAEDLAAVWKALGSAKTWAQFRSMVSPQRYEETVATVSEGIDFESFFAEESESEPGLSREEALRRYRALDVSERIPLDEDAFHGYDLPQVSDGDYPEWPAQQMLTWMPEQILERPFSRRQITMLNGEFLELDPAAEGEIVAALTAAGFRCSKDALLVLKACGRGPVADESEIPALIMALMSNSPDVRSESIESLAAIGPPAVPRLIESLSSANALIRQGVATALGEIIPVSEATVPALVDALHDSSEEVSQEAASALATLGPAAASAVPSLIEALRDDNPITRVRACVALRGIGPAASSAAPVLKLALADDATRWPAADALRKILPGFSESLRDDSGSWGEVLEADVFVDNACVRCGTHGALFATPRMFSACPKCLAERIRNLRALGRDLPAWLYYLEGAASGEVDAQDRRADAAFTVSFDDFTRCVRCGAVVSEQKVRYLPTGPNAMSPHCTSCYELLRGK